MKGSFIPTSLFVIVVVASGIGGQQHTALALPSCNSDRPNSWATHRTLSIPNSPEFFNKNSDDDDRWARALCCVYTHVEISDGPTGQAQMTTYDGSKYTVQADTFARAAERAMDDVCGMSMGSDDCRRRSRCVHEALSQHATDSDIGGGNAASATTTSCADDSTFARGGKTCRFVSSTSSRKRRRRLCRRARYRVHCPLTCGMCP